MASKSAGQQATSSGEDLNSFLTAQGIYLFINPRVTPNDAQLAHFMQSASQTGQFANIFYNQAVYELASRQVRMAGGISGYACGNIISPDFFDQDKMMYTINYIILVVSERLEEDKPQVQTRSGGRHLATSGFVVLRDLMRMDPIKAQIARRLAQQENPGSKFLDEIITLETEPFLYTEGLCANRASMSYIMPNGRRANGVGLMDLVHECAYIAGPAMFSGCKLSALAYVIQFYFNKFSYRFRKACDSDPAPYDRLNRAITRLPRIPDDDAALEQSGWVRMLRTLTDLDFNAELSAERAIRIGSLRDREIITYDKDGDPVNTTRIAAALARLGMHDQGYKMYLCFYDNPTLGIMIPRPSPFTQTILENYRTSQGRQPTRKAAAKQRAANFKKQGGRRRRRKRTKKRALKKRHRRTRRRRKRKTRRKRRGGKKRLSRKQCHSLKQKHTKMAHQLHRAGQAIRVQCGMRGGRSSPGALHAARRLQSS